MNIGVLNGLNGNVALSVSGLPTGANGTFTPSSVAGSGSAMLNVTTSALTTPAGTSTVTITGTSGALTHATTVLLVVNAPPPAPDFTIALSPPSRTVAPGGNTSYTVTVTAQNGFSGTVTLSPPSGLPANVSASFSPGATITGSGSVTMNVTTQASTPTSSSTLSISGTSGSLSHSASATLVVNSAPAGSVISIDFVGSGVAMAASESAGVVARTNWNSATGALRTTPLALVKETGAASGASATWSSNNTWLLPVTDQAGSRRMMRGYLDTTDTSVTHTEAA